MEIQLTAILLQMLNFGVVVGALVYLLLKPVRKMLDERAQKIAAAQKASEAVMAEKNAIVALKEKAEKEARSEAKTLMTQARKDVDARKEELMTELKAEIAAARAKAMKSLETEKMAALENMQSEFEKAVLTVSERVIGASVDAKQHAALIKQGLKEIAA